MKRLMMLCVFSVLSTFSLNLLADAGANQAPEAEVKKTAKEIEIDNTMSFFIALNSCIPGHYKEKNILAATVGSEWLEHTINGISKDACSVTLATPDGRQMNCDFVHDKQNVLTDQHFIMGILTNTANNPSKEALKADRLWSDLKSTSCNF